MLTSYLFFIKINDCSSPNEQMLRLKKYVFRNLKLYLFWSIVLMPFIIRLHLNWFLKGTLNAILQISKSIMLGFFPASWFIIASIVSVTLIFLLSKKLKNIHLILFSIIMYIPCLIFSNYAGIFDTSSISDFNEHYLRVYLSFPVALIWVSLGKVLSEHHLVCSFKLLSVMFLCAVIMYYLEFFFINRMGYSVATDCYVMSIPVTIFLFVIIGLANKKYSFSLPILRKVSVIIYCTHQTILMVIQLASLHYNLDLSNSLCFALTLSFSLITSLAICALEHKFHIMKYAY